MEIPIRFKLFLFWKSMFNERFQAPQIKISKEGTGVRSILFFLPEKREHAKIVNYLVKVDSSLSGYTIGYVCNEQSKSYYANSDNMKFITYNDDDLNYIADKACSIPKEKRTLGSIFKYAVFKKPSLLIDVLKVFTGY